MPCDSVAIALAKLSELGLLVLSQIDDATLGPLLVQAVAVELVTLLPGYTVLVENRRLLVQVDARTVATVVLNASGRTDVLPTDFWGDGYEARQIGNAVGLALDRVGVLLVGEMSRAQLFIAGCQITSDERMADGTRVLSWTKEVD